MFIQYFYIYFTISYFFLPDCRDCSLNACISVAKADGSCDGCICNGLLLPDCDALNCTASTPSSSCSEQMDIDGCLECICTEEIQNVCPPIPACPSRCQIQLTSGCPICTCPDEATERPCPLVSCPASCKETVGPDGCPTCECPPPDTICPQMPACPLGCIDQHEKPAYENCLECNCTIIEELLNDNQIIPTDAIDDALGNEAEIFSEAIDPGLFLEDNPDVLYDTSTVDLPFDTTTVDFFPPDYPDQTVSPTANIPPNAGRQPAPPSHSDRPSNPLVPSNSSPNPQRNRPDLSNRMQDGRPNPNQNPQSNRQPQPNPNRNQQTNRQPQPNIPCGDTSCPQGCSLCIQRDGCGRCLCGDNARVCPPVPACPVNCISAGADGCISCNCPSNRLPPNVGTLVPSLADLPIIPALIAAAGGIDFNSAEDFFPGPLPPNVNILGGPPPGIGHFQGQFLPNPQPHGKLLKLYYVVICFINVKLCNISYFIFSTSGQGIPFTNNGLGGHTNPQSQGKSIERSLDINAL